MQEDENVWTMFREYSFLFKPNHELFFFLNLTFLCGRQVITVQRTGSLN
jgi:hypothetical protein